MEASKGGRHQIGILAGFILEQVAGFILECMAGFVGIRKMKDKSPINPQDYTLAVRNCGGHAKPWRWEIGVPGKSNALQQSDFFATMSEASRAGKAALAELRAKSLPDEP